jgi:methionyl-tRNA formyltransferase
VTDLVATLPKPPRLRTVLCTIGGLHGALVLRRLRDCDRLEVCAVIRSSRVLEPGYGFLRGAVEQIRRSGLRYALYLWCATTLADWLCRVTGLGAVPTRSAAGLPVYTTRNVNDAEGLEFLAACAPDLLVSAFFNQRVHAPALALPKYGCLNIHPALLPEAKGVDPVFQSLLHGGVPPLGVTVHFMTPELDAGRIVAQRPIEARAGSSVFAITARLFDEGAELLATAIESIAGGATGSPQIGAGNYQSWPTRLEVRRLRARGGVLWHFADFVRLRSIS